MAEGFKLLDAYVEVKASGKGLADSVAGDIQRESSGRLGHTGSAMGGRLLGGMKSQLGAEAMGGLVGDIAHNVESQSGPHLQRSGSSMGGNLLGGLKGAFTSGAVGGLVGGVVGGVASGLTSIVAGAVSDIGGMLTTVGGQIASTVIDFNSQLQNATIGFTTMLGSGVKAKSFMDELQNFAKTTPFEFTNLVHNAQNMMGMGIAAKNVVPYLRALGDSVASIGGSAAQVDQVTLAFDQMAAKGTLDMGNMNQLMQGGVPNALRIMASAYGVTTSKMIGMISAGDVQASRALPALIKGIEKGTKSTAALGGMMDKQSQTFTGALSNIQDGLTQTTAKAFKPFFDVASKGMQRFATALSGKPAEKFQRDVTKAIKPLASAIGGWFKTVDIGKIFTQGGKAFTGFLKSFKPKDVIKGLQDFVKAGGDIAKEVLPLFPKLIKLIHDWLPVAVGVTKWAVDTGKAFKHGADQWKDAFDVLGAGMKDAGAKVNHGGSQISDAAKNTVTAWSHGADQLNGFFSGVAGFFRDLVGSFQHGWSQIAGFVSGGVKAFQHGADQIVGFFQGIPGTMLDIGGHIVSGLVGGIQGAWGAVTSTVSDLVHSIPAGVRKILGIASPSKVFHTIGQQVSQGLHRGLLGSVDQIKVAAGQLANAVTSGFHGSGVSSITRYIQHDAKVLEAMSKYRAKWIDKLATDQGKLKDVLSARKDFAAGVKSNVMGNADVSSIYGTSMQSQKDKRQAALDFNAEAKANNAAAVAAAKVVSDPTTRGASLAKLNGVDYQPSWTTTTPGTAGTVTGLTKLKTVPKVSAHAGLLAVKASLKKLLADTKKFASNLKYLMYRGIDPYTYDELVQAGVRGGGLEMSAELLADPKLARQVYSLERQVAKAGGKLGTQTATHEYYGKVASARAAVAYDKQEVHNYNIAMTVTAKDIDDLGKLVRMFGHVKATARKKKSKH